MGTAEDSGVPFFREHIGADHRTEPRHPRLPLASLSNSSLDRLRDCVRRLPLPRGKIARHPLPVTILMATVTGVDRGLPRLPSGKEGPRRSPSCGTRGGPRQPSI